MAAEQEITISRLWSCIFFNNPFCIFTAWQYIFEKANLQPNEISEQDNLDILNFKPRREKTMDDLTGPLADQYRDAFGALPAAEINGEIPRAKRVKRHRISLGKSNQG